MAFLDTAAMEYVQHLQVYTLYKMCIQVDPNIAFPGKPAAGWIAHSGSEPFISFLRVLGEMSLSGLIQAILEQAKSEQVNRYQFKQKSTESYMICDQYPIKNKLTLTKLSYDNGQPPIPTILFMYCPVIIAQCQRTGSSSQVYWVRFVTAASLFTLLA